MKTTVLIFFLFLFGISSAHAQWMPMNTPYPQTPTSLFAYNGTVYASSSNGQWTTSNNGVNWYQNIAMTQFINGSGPAQFLSNGSVVMMTVGSNCYISTDSLAHLNLADTGLPANIQIEAIAGNANDLYLATDSGVYMSANSGANWKLIGPGTQYIIEATAMVATGNTLLVALLFSDSSSLSSGVYRTTDNGTHWTLDSATESWTVTAFASEGGNIYATNLNGTTDGVYCSSDNGATWVTFSNGLSENIGVVAIGVYDGMLYTCGEGTLYTSSQGGSWTAHPSTDLPSDAYAASFVFTGSSIMIGVETQTAQGGVWVTTDNGGHWIQRSNGFSDEQMNTLYAHNGMILAGTNDYGFFRSTDNGTTWVPANNGIPYAQDNPVQAINDITANDDTLYASVISDTNGIYRSTDNGLSWSSIYQAQGYSYFDAVFAANGLIFCSQRYQGLLRSADDGIHWSTDSVDFQPYSTVTSFASIQGELLAGNSFGCYASTDNGLSWNIVGSSFPKYTVNTLCVMGDTLYQGDIGGIFYSTDLGNIWIGSSNFYNNQVHAVIGWGNTMFAGTDGGIHYSSDHGLTWRYCNDGLGDSTINAFAISGGYIFAAGQTNIWRRPLSDFVAKPPVSFSTDSIVIDLLNQSKKHSDTIIIKNSGNVTLGIDSIRSTDSSISTVYPDSIAAGDSMAMIIFFNDSSQQSGIAYLIIYTSDSSHSVDTIKIILQEGSSISEPQYSLSFRLSQNYPNPFSSSTTISFSLPQSGVATLKVYDALGREVADLSPLLRGTAGGGAHSIQFDGSNLPDGMYFYRLTAGTFSQGGEMAVMK